MSVVLMAMIMLVLFLVLCSKAGKTSHDADAKS